MSSSKYMLATAIALLLAMIVTKSGNWIDVVAQTTEPSRFPSGIRGLADAQDKPPSRQWLLDARNDGERWWHRSADVADWLSL